MYRTVFWTLWERERVGWFGRMALKYVKYHIPELLLAFSYCEQYCYAHGYANISLRLTFQFFQAYTRSGTSGSHSNSIFNFLRNLHIAFHSGCTISHSHQQGTGFNYSTWGPTRFLFPVLFFNSSHPNGCRMISHCGIDLHFPDDSANNLLLSKIQRKNIKVFRLNLWVFLYKNPFILNPWNFFQPLSLCLILHTKLRILSTSFFCMHPFQYLEFEKIPSLWWWLRL